MGRKPKDITGKSYGNLTVSKIGYRQGNNLFWELECNCGEICYATFSDLERGRKNYCISCNHKKSKESILSLLYENYKRNALKRNYIFDLTLGQFEILINKDCHYCGSEPLQIFKKKGMLESIKYNGIDRQDNEKGYTLENTVTSCKFCNFAKSNYDIKDFLNWLERIKQT